MHDCHTTQGLVRLSLGIGVRVLTGGACGRPATSMMQSAALIEPAYVLEIEADAVIG
jgi:hypothetical protein